jgi:hypothetical protein
VIIFFFLGEVIWNQEGYKGDKKDEENQKKTVIG